MQQQSNVRAYAILSVIAIVLVSSYIYLLRGMLTLNHPPPQALATSTISAMYKRQANLSSRCDVSSSDGRVEDCVLSRLINYCAVDTPAGNEGSKSAIPASEWRLEHLVLNIRHGDRTAIHGIENSFKPLPYEGSGDLQSHKILHSLRIASKFRVGPLIHEQSQSDRLYDTPVTSEGYEVYNYNPIDTFLEVPDRHLYSGQLTTVGFYQHILLGEHLNGAYSTFLQRIQSPSHLSSPRISVRSTSYNRTIQSAAGMLSTLLPSSVHFSDVHIGFTMHSSVENMHGFVSNKFHHSGSPVKGGQLSSHTSDERTSAGKERARDASDSKTTWGQNKNSDAICPKAIAALQRMSSSYEDTTPETLHRLTNVYSPIVIKPYSTIAHITNVADPLLTSFCHQEKYACGQDSNKCGSDSLLRAVMTDSDRSFCERYTSIYGGLEYTRLDIYPFMVEIKDALVEAAEAAFARTAGEGKSGEGKSGAGGSGNAPLLHVFSGHDTVIAPVLTALGIYQHSSYCNWPNYASRIAFEAWTPVGKAAKKYGVGTRNGDNMFSVQTSNMHVRVVYNGEDVTSHIPMCTGSSVQFGKKGAERASLCPLALIVKQIESNLGPGKKSLEQACRQ